jgi:diguanylate cyclase (GGDEF)-like protein
MDTLRAALEASFDPVLLLEGDTYRLLYANRAARGLLFLPADALEQISPSDLGLDKIVAEARERTSISTDRELDLSVSLRRSDGTPIRAVCRVVLPAKESSDSSVAILIFRPDSTSDQLPETTRDPLTGLVDRRVFEARLANMLEHGCGETSAVFALLFVDLNGFKAVNDAWGHLAGDQVLREIAGRLRHCLRPNDTVARFGGDEFTALLEGVDSACDATSAAARLLDRIEQPIVVDGREVAVSASVGIVLSGPNFVDGQDLLEAADRAMYRAKAQGPSRHVVFDEDSCPPFPKP